MLKFIIFALLVVFTLAFREKVERAVFKRLTDNRGKADIFVDFKGAVVFADLKNTLNTMTHIQKGRFVVDHLKGTAERSQFAVKHILAIENVEYQDFWIQNSLLVKQASLSLIEKLAKRREVKAIRWDRIVPRQNLEVPLPFAQLEKNKYAPEFNVRHVKADKVWAKGFTGQGMVVGLSDTGVQWDHEALKASYRGNENGQVNHNYNWLDPSGNSRTPVDRNGHGTHVTGTAAGGSQGRRVGVAPGAKWIACRPFGGSSSRTSNFVRCNQFFLAPTDLNGNNPNPDLRPHATSHSYVCRNCGMRPSIQALYAAGVFFIKSCGNSGSRCSTITDPGNYPEVYCIAALAKESDVATRFSSRGPSRFPSAIKPSFSAPGESVNSAYIGAGGRVYRALSGTSMAAPCFNGAVALLWSAVPELERELEKTIQVFQESSLKQTSGDCNSPQQSPNHVYGYGTINLEAAVALAIKKYRK